jgi:hypothetical protein
MKLLKHSMPALFICMSVLSIAQNNTVPKWLSMKFTPKVSFQTAAIQINNKDASYADLLKLADSSILKIEVYDKKAAQQLIGKDEGKNGLVQVTLHKKHFPYPMAKKDSALYIIDDKGDTIHCTHTVIATIDGDTSNAEWNHFLMHNLNPSAPADNGSPAGLYYVDIMFVVNKDSTVSNVEVLEDPGYGTAAEVRRLMGKSPAWNPAMCNDTPVNFRQKQRITFMVSEE